MTAEFNRGKPRYSQRNLSQYHKKSHMDRTWIEIQVSVVTGWQLTAQAMAKPWCHEGTNIWQGKARHRIKLHSFPIVILITVIWDVTQCSLVDNYICMFQTKQLPPPSTVEIETQYICHDYQTNYTVLHLRRSC